MKKISILIMLLGSLFCSIGFASEDCENCEDTNSCPPQPPADCMPINLGE